MKHSDIIQLLFYTTDLIHFNHLNTTSYAIHKALGKAYDSLNEFKDSISEVLIGKEGRIDTLASYSITVTTPEEVVMEIKNVGNKLKEYSSSKGYTELVNVAEEILMLGCKINYLITLK